MLFLFVTIVHLYFILNMITVLNLVYNLIITCILNTYFLSLHILVWLFFIKYNTENFCNIIYNWHLYICINNGVGWYYNTLIRYLMLPISILLLFRNTEVFWFDYKFTCINYLPICGLVVLYFVWFR